MTLELDVSTAPDRLFSMAGLGDNRVRYSPGRNQPGKCTRWQWLALGAFANTTPLPHAVGAWDNAPAAHRHPLTERPYRGAIAVLGATNGPRWAGDENWRYGDVAMFTGGGLDSPNWEDWELGVTDSSRGLGVIGTMTFGNRHRQTGRHVEGWLSSYGGAILLRPGSASTPKPLPEVPAVTPIETDDTMKITWDAAGKQPFLWDGEGRSWGMTNVTAAGQRIQLPTVLTLVRRWLRADQNKAYPEKFNALENAILRIVFSNLK